MPHPGPVNVRQPGVFHDLASAGVSEPVQWVEREQSRDIDMLQTVPQHRFFQPFIIEHQNFVEYRMAPVSLERLGTRTQIVLENPFGYNDNEHANCELGGKI